MKNRPNGKDTTRREEHGGAKRRSAIVSTARIRRGVRHGYNYVPDLEGHFRADRGDEDSDLIPLVVHLVRAPAGHGGHRRDRGRR